MAIGFTFPLNASEPIEDHSAEPVLISQITDWQPYGSEEAQFSAQFPSEPETRTRSVAIAGLSTDWTIFRVQDDTGFYAVAYTDLTPEAIELGANAAIDSIENTLAEEFNWSALNGRGRPIEVDGYPTREIIGTQNNQLSVLRLILADQRLYAVMSTSDSLENVGEFVSSFAIEPWQPYVSEDGGFSVSLPMAPDEETEITPWTGKEFNWTVIESRSFTAPNDSYAVAYTDVSADDLQGGEDALLEQLGSNLVERLQPQAVIESGREISLDGHPGRSFVATTEDGQIVGVNFYLVGQRLYGVGARADDVVNISQFLDSFEIR
ncbi:hypothetical protein C7B76_02420 [filamentous cyanobacterium CCP2]|nr:hypothetical protein C7B76_02420 [filamentous cyanobacterium CCP2]